MNVDLSIYGAPGAYRAHTDVSNDGTLMPCPFCGSVDLEVSNTHTPSYWVTCECGVEAHAGMVGDKVVFVNKGACTRAHRKAFAAAIALWNTRANGLAVLG